MFSKMLWCTEMVVGTNIRKNVMYEYIDSFGIYRITLKNKNNVIKNWFYL